MNGQLSEQPLAELIREIAATKMSGALRLTRERVRAVLYTQAGALTYARSNLHAHRLTQCLRRWGFLTTEQLATFAGADAEADVCAALVAARVIAAHDLPNLRVRQATDVLRPLLLWTDGAWSYDPRARLAEAVAGAVATNELLLESARRLPVEFAAARLADEDMLAPARAPLAQLTLLPTEAFILSRVDMPLKLAELVAISGLPEAQTRHTAYALALAGLLERAVWPRMFDERAQAQARATHAPQPAVAAQVAPAALKDAPPVEPAPEAEPDPQAEIADLLARVRGADNYQTLGVARTAAADEIKRAYYALAKRFHPDRFRRAVDDAERTRIETAFAQIAQAYETLSDDKARAAYDLKLPAESAAKSSPAHAPVAVQRPAPGASQAVKQASAEENFQHGLAALKHDNQRMAAAYLAEAVRLAPQQARYHAYYGRALAHDPRTRRQAETAMQTAITLDPANATYHVMLAELYQLLGHTRRAEGELIRALGHDPRHAGARQLLDQIKRQ